MIAPVEPLSIAGFTRTPLPVDAGSGYTYSLCLLVARMGDLLAPAFRPGHFLLRGLLDPFELVLTRRRAVG
jgi:hypothetical protein